MSEEKYIHQLDNGLTVLAENVPSGESVSYVLKIPCGTCCDPDGKLGLAGLVSEMIVRGAGEYGNRELLNAFENLGIETYESVSKTHSSFGAALLGENIGKSLALTADIIRRPHFPKEEFEPSRQVLLQEIAGLEDEPSRKLLLELDRTFFPAPWARPEFGTEEGLAAIEMDDILNFHRNRFSPRGSILSVAGKIQWNGMLERIEELFGDWSGPEPFVPVERKSETLVRHIPFESEQTHLGLAFPLVPVTDPKYRWLKCVVSALSGGMSSRLFTEVREKRGLCYTVSASYVCNKNLGAVFCYCGSGNETAQEALEVIVGEIQRLRQGGITQKELDLLKIRTKSSLAMSRESTAARAASMARNYYFHGRDRSVREILERVDKLKLDEVNAKIAEHPMGPFRLVTLGPKPLEIDPALLG